MNRAFTNTNGAISHRNAVIEVLMNKDLVVSLSGKRVLTISWELIVDNPMKARAILNAFSENLFITLQRALVSNMLNPSVTDPGVIR